MRTILQTLLSLLTLAALAWVTYQGYTLLQREQAVLDAGTQALVVLAAFLAIVCAFLVGAAIRNNGQVIAQAHLLPQKLKLYKNTLLCCSALLQESSNDQKAELETELEELQTELGLQASRKVLQAMEVFRDEIAHEGQRSQSASESFDKLLHAMRIDLGQHDFFTLSSNSLRIRGVPKRPEV